MLNLANMTVYRNSEGLRVSLGILAILWIMKYIHLKPHFVIPENQSSMMRKRRDKIVLLVMIVSIVLTPLELTFSLGNKQKESSQQYIQVLLDISLSMAAADVQPSRFQVAKDALEQVLQGISWDTVSLIAFSGIPLMTMPFSPHKNAVISRIWSLRLSEFPPTHLFVGTAVGDALLMGIDNLQTISQSQRFPWTIILVTDGDSSRGLDPYGLTSMIQQLNIPVFTLAIWRDDEIIWKDDSGALVEAPLDTELLQVLADETGWYFVHVQNWDEIKDFVQEVKKQLNEVKTTVTDKSTIELNHYLLRIIFGAVMYMIVITWWIYVHTLSSTNKSW